eukprot:2819347-Amphidinium_carterae.1
MQKQDITRPGLRPLSSQTVLFQSFRFKRWTCVCVEKLERLLLTASYRHAPPSSPRLPRGPLVTSHKNLTRDGDRATEVRATTQICKDSKPSSKCAQMP